MISHPRHFLTLMDFCPQELESLIERAIFLKKHPKEARSLSCKVLAMVFEKSSTRTRVAFESAMAQMGGAAIFLSPRDSQLGRGEPVSDMARVLSRMANAIVVRAHQHETLQEFVSYATVPVINALTNEFHPCQLLADIQTFIEHRGSIRGKTVTWVGDGYNMCQSYIQAARQFGFKLNICTPPGYLPKACLLEEFKDHIEVFTDPKTAATHADLVVTDAWISMGQEEETAKRMDDFKGFQVNQSVMGCVKKDALFMHCLPAHREEEVSTDVIDGPQSVVWDEAENRLHAQKALLEFLL